jgi:hypothetical protein
MLKPKAIAVANSAARRRRIMEFFLPSWGSTHLDDPRT